MTMAKKLPLLAPSIHTFEVNGTYSDCEAKRTVFMAIQKMVSVMLLGNSSVLNTIHLIHEQTNKAHRQN